MRLKGQRNLKLNKKKKNMKEIKLSKKLIITEMTIF